MNISPILQRRSADPAPADAPHSDKPGPVDVGKGRLLIVDDIRDNREILRRRFERHGDQVTEAEGGVEALALIERKPLTWCCWT